MPKGFRGQIRWGVGWGSPWLVAMFALYALTGENQWLALAMIVVVIFGLAVYARLVQEHPKQQQSD